MGGHAALCPPYAPASPRLDHPAEAIARFRNRPYLPVRLVARLQRHFEILQEMTRKAFRLHVGEVQAEAHMRAAAIRHPSEAVAGALGFVRETHRIELVRIGPV